MTKPADSHDDQAKPGGAGDPKPNNAGAGAKTAGGSAGGSTDESIGRPGPWREGRYEESGKPVGESVVTPGGPAAESHDEVSTPVTRKDYEGGRQP